MGKNKKKSKSNKGSDQSQSESKSTNNPPGKEIEKSTPSKDPANVSSDTLARVDESNCDVLNTSSFSDDSKHGLENISKMEISADGDRKPYSSRDRPGNNWNREQGRRSSHQSDIRRFGFQKDRRETNDSRNSLEDDPSESRKRYRQPEESDGDNKRNSWNNRDSGGRPWRDNFNKSGGKLRRDNFNRDSGGRPKRDNSNRRKSWADDEEFLEYEENFKRHRGRIEYKKVHEIVSDLFKLPEDYSLAHCVAEDLNMGSGIAVIFRQKFGQVPLLLNQRESTGGCAILPDKKRFIYYLITKRWSFGKPTYKTLHSSLKRLRAHAIEHNIKKLAMPRIGCGLDRLEWDNVKFLLEFMFQKTDVEITICNLEPTEDSSTSPQKHRNCKVTNATYPIKDIEEGTIILYFSSEDGHISEDMKQLDEKFNFLMEFRNARKISRNVILYSKKPEYLVCGCIVKKTQRDPFDFSSLTNCLNNIKKENKQYQYSYYAYQAIRDNDRDINYKIINILRNNLRDVEVYVCWPGDLQDLMSPKDRGLDERSRDSIGSYNKSNNWRLSGSQRGDDRPRNDSSFGSYRSESGPSDVFDSSKDDEVLDMSSNSGWFQAAESSNAPVAQNMSLDEDVSFDEDVTHDFEIYSMDLAEDNIDCAHIDEHTSGTIFQPYSRVCYALEDFSIESGVPPGPDLTPSIGKLLNHEAKEGDLVYLNEGNKFLYCIIISRKASAEKVFSSIRKLKDHVKKYGVKKLVIPEMNCPTDGDFFWSSVKFMYEYLLGSSGVKMFLSPFQKEYDCATISKKNNIKSLKHVKSPLHQMSKKSILILLGSADGDLTDQMGRLRRKFQNLQNDYVRQAKAVGNVIRYKENEDYVVYTCLVKSRRTDRIDFEAFQKCLLSINEQNKKEKLTRVGLEADRGEENSKIVTLLMHCLRDVEIIMHWPGDLRDLMPQART